MTAEENRFTPVATQDAVAAYCGLILGATGGICVAIREPKHNQLAKEQLDTINTVLDHYGELLSQESEPPSHEAAVAREFIGRDAQVLLRQHHTAAQHITTKSFGEVGADIGGLSLAGTALLAAISWGVRRAHYDTRRYLIRRQSKRAATTLHHEVTAYLKQTDNDSN